MTKKGQVSAKCAVVAFAAAFLIVGSASSHASPNARAAWPVFTVVAEKSKEGPPGWAEFCRNYKSECDVKPSDPHKIAVTAEVWDKLVDVNRWANTHIKPTEDRKHWGRINKWYFADDSKGDCKDYVIVKRRMLMEAGLPREALLITIVWTPQEKGHAVLIVRTDKGDYVLDSLFSKIVLWKETPYDYVMRQSQSNPNGWLFIDGDPLKPPALADKSIAENPLDEPVVMISGLDSGKPKQEVIAISNIDQQQTEKQVSRATSMTDR
jgi:predicted transglutaminase-like cysteine proteinase